MHDKDLARVWERWSKGDSLSAIAADLGMVPSVLHAELQVFLERRAEARQESVAASIAAA